VIKTIFNGILILLIPFFLGCEEKKVVQSKKVEPPLLVETVTVQKDKFPVWMEYTGKTKASSEQEIRARVSGRLEKIYFKDGQVV